MILDPLAEGESWDTLLKGFPELTRLDIRSAIYFARAAILNSEVTELAAA